MKQNFYLGLDSKSFHHVAYNEWGTPNSNPIICVHGLSRNSRDFDFIAQALAKKNHYVVCPDVVGRGESDWLLDPNDYNYHVYLSDMGALIARLNAEHIGWIGTSMGGIFGMILASLPNTPIKYLVLNDVGPLIQATSLDRIKKYVDAGLSMVFDDLAHAEKYFRSVMISCGDLTDEQWKHIAKYATRKMENGKLRSKTDPAIQTVTNRERRHDVNLWHIWRHIKCPVLIIQGSESDVLSSQTVRLMKKTHPLCESVELAGVGHAPALMSADEIEIITKWVAQFSW